MINSNSDLAWRYNQQMVLENHSLFQCLSMLREDGTDIFKNSLVNGADMISLIIKLVRLASWQNLSKAR